MFDTSFSNNHCDYDFGAQTNVPFDTAVLLLLITLVHDNPILTVPMRISVPLERG